MGSARSEYDRRHSGEERLAGTRRLPHRDPSSPRRIFLLCHLDSYANLDTGDEVKAGDLLGFMGDTGYGTDEGTMGKFPVHLHLGIYINSGGQEISVNPYPALKYTEEKKIDYEER